MRFTVFDKSNTRGLRTNRFTALHEDNDGTLLIGTGDGGLSLYRDGVFTSYAADAAPSPPGEVMSFDHDLKGELLVRALLQEVPGCLYSTIQLSHYSLGIIPLKQNKSPSSGDTSSPRSSFYASGGK